MRCCWRIDFNIIFICIYKTACGVVIYNTVCYCICCDVGWLACNRRALVQWHRGAIERIRGRARCGNRARGCQRLLRTVRSPPLFAARLAFTENIVRPADRVRCVRSFVFVARAPLPSASRRALGRRRRRNGVRAFSFRTYISNKNITRRPCLGGSSNCFRPAVPPLHFCLWPLTSTAITTRGIL